MRKVVIIGAGRAGCSIAKNLQKSEKFTVTAVTDIDAEIATKSGKFIEVTEYAGTDSYKAIAYGEIIIISTPDDYIESTCNQLSESNHITGKFIFHLSGSRPSSILNKAKSKNCRIGSIHPLQSMPSPKEGYKNLKKAFFCIEGDTEAVNIAKEMASEISEKYFTIDTQVKSVYHAAAVFASNFINTVVYSSFLLFKKIGVPEDNILEVILPLIKGTVTNIEKLGVVNSLTGPAIRGDSNTIEAHIKGLNYSAPEFTELYKILTEQTVKLALANDNPPDETQIKKILKIIDKQEEVT